METFKKLLESLTKALGLSENLTDPKQYDIKKMKRMAYQLEAAQNYIFVDEGSGEFQDLDLVRKMKLKKHYRKQAFDSA